MGPSKNGVLCSYTGQTPTEQVLTTGLERAGYKTDLEGRILRPGDLLDIGSEGTIWLTDDLPALVGRSSTIYWTFPWVVYDQF